MESESQNDIFDENLKRLLGAACQEDSAFQTRILDVVLREVGQERSAIHRRRIFRGLSIATATAAVVAIAWSFMNPWPQSVGQFQPVYGVAELTNGDGTRTILSGEPLHAGTSIRTLSGSKAEILLADGSRVMLSPRTTVQIDGGKRGPAVRLETGTVHVQAAKQHYGRKLVIETPGSRVTTLGTVFTVQLSTKPDGTRRTRVGVASGLVEFESGGQTIQLPARTEGFAEEGQLPEKHLASLELDEMVGLIHRNGEIAARLNKRQGSPAIILCRDGSTAAIWTAIGFDDLRETGRDRRTLRLKSPASGARLFTLDGREVPTQAQGRDLRVDVSALDPGVLQDTQLILELPDVKGVLQTDGKGMTRLALPRGASNVVSLLQFHLPDGAKIEHISPDPVEITRMLNRMAVTVAADAEGLEVFE